MNGISIQDKYNIYGIDVAANSPLTLLADADGGGVLLKTAIGYDWYDYTTYPRYEAMFRSE